MKKRFILLAILLTGGTFTQCEQKLNLNPLGVLDEATFYQTEDDFKSAILISYSALLNYTYEQFDEGGWFQGVLLPDDDVTTANNDVNQLETFNWTSTNDQWRRLWMTTYKGIQRANIVIEKLPVATGLSEAQRKSFEGEAKFLRAYYNFLLAIHFGTAPLIEKTPRTLEETRASSSTPGQLWDAVIADLRVAKAGLPATWNDANLGRATSQAASALLGKALLYRVQWENKPELYTQAAAEFQGLIGKYSLVPNFQDNFKPDTENNAESIFEVQMGIGGFNPWLTADYRFGEGGAAGTARLIYFRAACGLNPDNCAPGANGQGYGRIQITSSLQREFEAGDPRRAATIFLDGDVYKTGTNANGTETSPNWIYRSTWSATGSSPAKYVIGDNNIDFRSNLSVNNERLIRYADVLLMLAECKILGPTKDFSGAADLINQVRRRADPTGTKLPDVVAGTEADMFKALAHERRVEFALESHRYNDLVRWHRAGKINIKNDIDFGRPAANAAWSEKNLIKPIPQSEIDLNQKIVQNPGF